jgi:hypothetical protein
MNIQAAAESFALNEYLSHYPDEWDYDTIINAIADGDYYDDIDVWQPFENDEPDEIVNNIDNTRLHFIRIVTELVTDNHAMLVK